MEHKLYIGGQEITLVHDSFDKEIDVDQLTMIDTSNIYGEALTVPALLNRIGLLKESAANNQKLRELERKTFEAELRAQKRKEASDNSGFFTIRVEGDIVRVKSTEKALEAIHVDNPEWIELRKKEIAAISMLGKVEVLYWSVQAKAKSLENMTSQTAPEDFVAGIIEGKVNGFNVRK